GGVLNAFELMKAMIAAGAAGVHWGDQLASGKKCGHLGGEGPLPPREPHKTVNAPPPPPPRLRRAAPGGPPPDPRPAPAHTARPPPRGSRATWTGATGRS